MQRQALSRRGRSLLAPTAAAVLAVLVAAALAAHAAAAPPPPATPSAARPSADGLHDARYCEILVLRGAVPDARVTVWNTIGLNDCPPAWWDALDAGALAGELGAGAVILNGPRHFLMDSASGRVGAERSFAGMRLRRVAAIRIRAASDLVQTPYSERTIDRHNTWRWDAGRRVYELLAPDGSRYVMQSYAQIRDPELAIGDLSSLADRLALPLGWRYRARRLHRDLVLRAGGDATIVQDDLLNTYQRLPQPPRSADLSRHRVELTGTTRTVGSPAPGTLEDRGTTSGRPFGPGSVTLEVTLAGRRAGGPFAIDSRRGSVFGTLDMGYEIAGSEITFRGTARIIGGTGAYREIRARNLRALDHNTLDGQSGTFTLDGFARY